MQIHAVYERNWKVTGFVSACCVAALVSSLFIVFIETPNGTSTPKTIGTKSLLFFLFFFTAAVLPLGLTGCYFVNVPRRYAFGLVPVLASESILCLFMLNNVRGSYVNLLGANMLQVLIQDRYAVFWFTTWGSPLTRHGSVVYFLMCVLILFYELCLTKKQ